MAAIARRTRRAVSSRRLLWNLNPRKARSRQRTFMLTLLIVAVSSLFAALLAARCAAAGCGARTAKAQGRRQELPIAASEAPRPHEAPNSHEFEYRGATPPDFRIPAHRAAFIGTFDRIEERLRMRLSTHNGAGKMNNINARAGPCRHSSCRGFSGFSRIIRELKIRVREAPSTSRKRRGSLRLWQTPTLHSANSAFLDVIRI